MLSNKSLFGVLLTILLCTQVFAYDLRYSAEILLNGEPSAIAVNPTSDTATVLSRSGRTLTVIDLATGAVSHEIPLEENPIGLTIHQTSNRAIVADQTGKLLFFDLVTGQLAGAVETGATIHSLAVDENKGVLLAGTGDGVLQFDLSELSLLPDSLLAGHVIRIAHGMSSCAVIGKNDDAAWLKTLDPDGAPLLEVDLSSEPTGLGLDEPLGILLTIEKDIPRVRLYDLATLEPVSEIPIEQPAQGLAVNPSTHRAYLSDDEGNLSVIDLVGKRLVETVHLFEQTGPLAVDPARNVALVGHGPNLSIVQLENPVPELTGIMPEESPAGSEGVQLTVSGARFIRDSSTRFDEQSLATGFEDNEHLTANVPPSELELPGDVAVAVRNPPPGGGESNRLTFKILTPMPQVSGLSPEKVTVGSPAMTLRVDGKNFLPSSSVHLGGTQVEARFISSIVLEAQVPPSLLAAEASVPVSVTNPGNVALSSNAFNLLVVPEDELPAEEASALPAGVGSLTGRILSTEMWPVEGVTIKIRGLSTRTNANGEFRLDNIPAGKRVVLMDGSTTIEQNGHYPTIPITVDIAAGAVNPMPFQPYLHRQKARNFATIDPARDTILIDPEVPGFEMRIPAGVNITGWDGKRNLRVSVRTVPADRLPVRPLPKNSFVRTVYMFYFDKVGGGVADRPIPIKSRNDLGLLPGEKAILWYFDESPIEGMAPNDWAIAGTGTVTPDGKYIVADPGTGIPKFCCGATGWGGTGAPNPPTGPEGPCGQGGDPVDLATGFFLYEKVDLTVPGIIPVQIKRAYRSRDSGSAVSGATGLGAFGKGFSIEYDWWLSTYQSMLLLIMPGNVQYRFDTQQPDGSYVNTLNPAMRGAKVTVNPDSTKVLRMRDGGTYTFNSYGELVEIADRNGNAVTIGRRHGSPDEGGYITSITSAEGKVITFNQSYVSGNFFRTDSITDPDGRTINYIYEDDPFSSYPRLKQVDYPDGSSIQYGYDSQGRMNSLINGRGIVEVTNVYDADNRVVSQVHPDGGTYGFSYSAPAGYVESTTMTTPNGAQTTWHFNADGYITQKVTPDGTFTYQKAAGTNELQSLTDPLGRTTSYTYYATSDVTNGLVHTKTDSLGNVTTYEYETTYGLPTKITEALGKITTMTHTIDPGTGELTRTVTTDPLGHSSTIDYNPYGLPASITDPNTNTTTFYYDDPTNFEHVTRVTDPLGNTVTYAYDAFGRLSSITDPVGASTTYAYDSMDRVRDVTDPLGGLTRYYYDLNGNLVWLIDPKGNEIRYEYDDRDRILKMTDQLGRYETYAYYRDSEITATTGDNLKSITDRKGQTTTFGEYDPMGRLKQVTYGDVSTTQYTYDAGGRVTAVTDSLSDTISYTYNDSGCGSCSGSALDRIASETTPSGTVSYTYDAVGRRTKMTFPGTPDITYTWDDAGRLVNINRTIDGTAKDFAIAYDPAGRRTSVQLPLYKSKGKWQYLKSTYGYDIASRLTSLLHQNPSGIIEDFNYTYDANGNRKSVSQSASIPLAAPLANTSYDEANEMVSLDGATFTYDLNGNLETKTDACGITNYMWDGRNRLTGISGFHEDCTPLSASFTYDALNRRIEKTVDGITTQYVYDGWDIIQETTGGITTNYTRTLNIDEPLALEHSDGTVRYFKADALGSISALTDENGVATTTYTYDAFGNTMVSGGDVNSLQYTGRENDGSGLYYYRARYYSPEMRRFISEDPVGFAGGMNFYAYVQNSPLTYVDPLGLSPSPLPPGRTRTRECTRDEYKICEAKCGSKGVQSCKISQTWRITRFKDNLSRWEWKDGPMSCSCNDGDGCDNPPPAPTIPPIIFPIGGSFGGGSQFRTPSQQPVFLY